MTTEVVRRLSPEEEELAAKREELARLEAELADRELALASLKAELAAFEGLYLRRVGVLYAELDDWNARVSTPTNKDSRIAKRASRCCCSIFPIGTCSGKAAMPKPSIHEAG